MKCLPTKQYRIVPGCGLVYRDHETFAMNWPKIHCSRKFYPPRNTRYTVYGKVDEKREYTFSLYRLRETRQL